MFKDEAQIEVEQLRQIAVSLARNDRLTIILNHKSKASYCVVEKGLIVISDQSIPENLREFPVFLRRARDALVAHEVGHLIMDAPVRDSLNNWEKGKFESLAKNVSNIVRDKRINHYIRSRYRWDVGKRLEELDKLTGEAWKETFLKRMDDKVWTLQEAFPQLVSIDGIYDTDVSDVWEKLFTAWGSGPIGREKVLQDFSYATNLVKKAPFAHMLPRLLGIMEKVYYVMLRYTSTVPSEIVPKMLGGDMEIFASAEVVEGLEAEQKEKSEGKADEKEKGDDMVSVSVGGGLGVEIPTPEPDPDEYERLVHKNASLIDELLRLLKTLTKPKVHRAKWRPRGRFMSEVLGKAYASSLRRPVNHLYHHQDVRMAEHEVKIGLLVDLSGSMSMTAARDALTVISEVAGRWLRDEDFAIMVFGSEYQKIKSFVEGYHNTRYRIGGTVCLNGTQMYQPLEEFARLFAKVRGEDPMVLVVVSDFQVNFLDQPRKVKERMEVLRRLGVVVVGVGLCSSDLQTVSIYTGKQSTFVEDLSELPGLFFGTYRKALEGRL